MDSKYKPSYKQTVFIYGKHQLFYQPLKLINPSFGVNRSTATPSWMKIIDQSCSFSLVAYSSFSFGRTWAEKLKRL